MTREEGLDWLYRLRSEIYVYMPKDWLIPMDNAIDMAIKALEHPEKNVVAVVPCGDTVSRQAVIDLMMQKWGENFSGDDAMQESIDTIRALPSVTPQLRKGHCKDCKWWKDSDGAYRRGARAESQCPINRREVFEGNGYCFLYEPQESEDI